MRGGHFMRAGMKRRGVEGHLVQRPDVAWGDRQLGPVAAGDDARKIAQMPAQVGHVPPRDQGERSVQPFGQPGQQVAQRVRHDDGVRAVGDLDEATVEIEKQRGGVGKRGRVHRCS